MACPYFLPGRRIADSDGVPGWKMPLGGVFEGECLAAAAAPWAPPEHRLRDCCNAGYARGRCDRFPADSPHDIVRLLIAEEREAGARLIYVYEKDHHPAGKGEVELPARQRGLLEAQAESYWNSYLERKCRAVR